MTVQVTLDVLFHVDVIAIFDGPLIALSLRQRRAFGHLAILKDAGLIAARKEGTTSFYRVTCGCLGGFFSCLEAMVVSDIKQRQSSAGRGRR